MSHQHDTIDLEFQPNLQRIIVPNVKIETTTVDQALTKFSDQAGMVRTSIKRAIPYRPVFCDRLPSGNSIFSRYGVTKWLKFFLGQFVPESAPSHMPLGDIFSREGGLFVLDVDDESLKLLTPSRKCLFLYS